VNSTGWAAIAAVATWVTVAAISSIITENVTDSLPRGYYIRTFVAPERSPFIAFPMPESMRAFFTKRGDIGFFDGGGEFIKRVGAAAGDEVCVIGDALRVNGVIFGKIRRDIPKQEFLPRWSECRRLEPGEILPLADAPGSIDGRFYGPIPSSVATGYRALWRY
jgi:type IV secretory pathway protease TraF